MNENKKCLRKSGQKTNNEHSTSWWRRHLSCWPALRQVQLVEGQQLLGQWVLGQLALVVQQLQAELWRLELRFLQLEQQGQGDWQAQLEPKSRSCSDPEPNCLSSGKTEWGQTELEQLPRVSAWQLLTVGSSSWPGCRNLRWVETSGRIEAISSDHCKENCIKHLIKNIVNGKISSATWCVKCSYFLIEKALV
jgi:hypothetical protein